MKSGLFTTSFFLCILLLGTVHAQTTALLPGQTIEKNLLKREIHNYTITLKKGEFVSCTVMQQGVDLTIVLTDPAGLTIKTFDSPNGDQGPEPIEITATTSGKYTLHIYPFNQVSGLPDTIQSQWPEQMKGAYAIMDIAKLSVSQYKQKMAALQLDKDHFSQWIASNAHDLETVDAGSGFEDLQPFKTILKDVQVVGLGEASHGTSEFFRMKHRMLEFLVKEMGFTSFYIEASMSRCRYINEYVRTGKGNLDTATAIQGFVTWRVEEVRNIIEWMRQYNATVPDEKKVKFYGIDLQINNLGWKALKDFYQMVNPQQLPHLDSLKNQLDTAAKLSNMTDQKIMEAGHHLFKLANQQCLVALNDLVMNQGEYQYRSSDNLYKENLMNMRLIVQEVASYQEGFNDRRDYYLAQNVLHLLNEERPGAKVVVWAHNGHIAKNRTEGFAFMGSRLADVLKDKYYAIGFEFYSGSFQTRNMDINNKSKDWDIMSVADSPEESLSWYFNKTGKSKFFIDFRNTGSGAVKNFSLPYPMHGFGSMYSTKWQATSPTFIKDFDGMIYIRESTAAKNFRKVYL